jgi:hypothetical protein
MKEEELRLRSLELSANILGKDARDLDALFTTSNKFLSYINGIKLHNIIKKPETKIMPTTENLIEIQECIECPKTFITKTSIMHPTKGAIPHNLYPFQEEMVDFVNNNHLSIVMTGRQMGKTSVMGSYLLWFAMYHSNKTIVVIASRFAQALEILDRIKFAYENLQNYLRAGVTIYNKGTIEFDNGSRIIVRACTKDATCGLSIDLMYIDELAFVSHKVAQEFWNAAQPTLSTGGKCIVTSTPNVKDGVFYHLWANSPMNGFEKLLITWDKHPDHDEAWKNHMIKAMTQEKFDRDFSCMFV